MLQANTVKTRLCKYCKTKQPLDDGIQTPLAWFCSLDHVFKYTSDKQEQARIRAKAKQIKEDKKRVRERKDAIKTKGDWMKEAQTAFNKFIRLRDAGNVCISCDKPDDGTHQRHASHYRSVGACPELRFCELNVWASCAQCNGVKSGNLLEYRIRLVKKIGTDKVEWLEGPHDPLRLTIDDIKMVKKKYQALCNEMLKEL